MPETHRRIYSSRSRVVGSRAEIEAQIRRILAVSRVNNQAASITGALAVIHNDARHSDVRVLAMEIAARRIFPIWSMGFFETAESGHPLAHVSFEAGFGGASARLGPNSSTGCAAR